MEFLLIKDDELTIASHLVSVGSGYYQDPDELAGLAHFTEHMVLQGSEGRNESLKLYLA